jgi:hypothetical protein
LKACASVLKEKTMGFMKEREIYKKGRTRVYINQCYNPGKKTKLFAVRRDDQTGLAMYLGEIRFDGGWRQYVFCPDSMTKWSPGCGRKIFDFCEEQTKKWREKWK